MSMGVPIAAWPMHSDQPQNTMLVTKVLRTGIAVKEWADRDELVTSSIINTVVRRLMASKEGDVMRERAMELGGAISKLGEEGGVTRMEFDSFIAHITRHVQ
ncbi:hypothetical protein RJ639_004407 [Escallonia herrerae]|uniref:Zeatin O-glucosyltransferase n=1 Tax=Escallonia herrerae TaxID=1293975 RepID=A0AA88W1Z3_9ASTE|nr:hypothetical protein RJ639_004407 [Escallonia herrerae]